MQPFFSSCPVPLASLPLSFLPLFALLFFVILSRAKDLSFHDVRFFTAFRMRAVTGVCRVRSFIVTGCIIMKDLTLPALKIGYSQKEIADYPGKHYTTISRITGKTLKLKT